MKLGFYNFYGQLNQNRMFENLQAEIGDEMNYPTVYLAKHLKELGHSIATIDMAPLESFDAVVFLDYPTKLKPPGASYFRRLIKMRDKPLYLRIIESPAVRPDNWWPSSHVHFKKIFTWSPKLADGHKYIRMHLPFKLPEFAPYAPSRAGKFCCLIASQKYSWAQEELYTERLRAIRWFEEHHPDEFDLYGQRWDRFYFKKKLSIVNPVLARVYRACPWLPRGRLFPSACGSVPTKRDVMRQYKFCLCYENASYPGWLTEKILDAMFAGSVPIYLGDPEAAKLVPPAAFIDKRNFRDYDALYAYLKEMPPSEYEGYRQAIHQFVHGDRIKPMGAEAFAEILKREIIGDPQQ
jgi:alpha(1,3/1,4) fucosyltransferase